MPGKKHVKAQAGIQKRNFFYHLEPFLLLLQRQLSEQSYRPDVYRYFHIRDPKPRKIAVAPFRDRVVHHALTQVLMPVFESTFIHDSYATRTGKGTHKAIERAQQFCRRYQWFYKMDIEHFFETVDQSTMLALIEHKVKDPKVLALSEKIIRNSPGDKGLPIGNLTSQFFANIYLNPLDHFIKEVLHTKAYLRYMDDFVIFSDSFYDLKQKHQQIEHFSNEMLQLKLKEQACWLNKTSHGLSFLGYRIFPGILRHCPQNYQRSKKRMNMRFKAYINGYMSEQALADSLQCTIAHLRHFC